MTGERPFAEGAQTTFDAGLSPFAADPVKRKPLESGVIGGKNWDARITAEDVERSISKHPDAALALRPVGYIILDIDDPEEFAELVAEIGEPGRPTFYSTARGADSKRRHLFYRVPEDLWTRSTFRGGEFISRNQRLAVAWPSINPKTCTQYQWYRPDGQVNDGPPHIDELPDLSPAWVEHAADRGTWKTGATDATVEGLQARCYPGNPSNAMREALGRFSTSGMDHTEMHARVGDLVRAIKLDPSGGVEAIAEARRVFLDGWPEAKHSEDFDNSLRDKIRELGLPPVTLPIAKAERKAIRRRNSPEGIEAAAHERKAARVAAIKTPSPGERVLEDGPLAEELAPTLAKKWALSPSHGLVRYSGKVWGPADESALIDDVRLLLVGIESEEHTAAAMRSDNKRMDRARTLLSRHRALNVAKLVGGILAKFEPVFDADPDLLNVQNGVVNLKTSELLPHDPAYYQMDIAGTNYRPRAKHPDVDALLKALPEEVRGWMQIRAGQAATGYQPDDTAVCVLEGGGSNSKSALINAIKSSLGTYARVAPEKLLLPGRGDHPTELASIAGARLVIVEELPEGRHINAQRVKALAGTGTLTARRMYRDNFEFAPKHATFIATNYTPQLSEVDEGTWRRFERVVFPYKYVDSPAAPQERQKDRGLVGRLLRGHAGRSEAMLAWIVEGARLWYENGQEIPAPPSSVAQAKIEWRSQTDLVMAFAAERLTFEASETATSKALAEAFTSWLFNNGHPAWSHQTISARLETHDLFVRNQVRLDRPYVDGKRTRAWVGVGLVPSEAVLDSYINTSRNK